MNESSATAVLDFPDVSDAPSPLPVRHAPRSSTIIPLACCFALLIAMAWPMFRGQVYVADDLGAFHLPMRAFYSQQLAAGEPFDWNPDLFGGFYLTGEGQVGTYHPLHRLLYQFLPLNFAFDLECWLSYPVMLLGMFVFLSRWRMSRSAALFGAMAFTFGGFNLLHFLHPNVIAVVSHLPWLLIAIDILLKEPSSRHRQAAFGAVALLTGSQLLLGHPQFVLFSLLIEACYVLFLTILNGSSRRMMVRSWSRWIGAVAIGALIGGIQLMPTFDFLAHSVRQSAGAELAGEGSLHPLNLIQLVAPYLFVTRVVGQNTHELGLYVGAVPLVLALWWLLGGTVRNRRERRLTIFAASAAAVALLWALGTFSPLGWFQAHLPLLNRFRFPSRAICLFQFTVAILAALGFAALMQRENEYVSDTPSGKSLSRLWFLPGISAVLAAFGAWRWPEHVAAWPLILAGPLVLAIAVWLVIRAASGARWALAAIVILAAADLGAYGLSYAILGHSQSLSEYVRNTNTPPGAAAGRVGVDLLTGTETASGQNGLRTGDRIVLAGWKCIDGYSGLEPARRLDYRQPAALRAAGVQWLSAQAAAKIKKNDASRAVGLNMTDAWQAITNSQPRAWLVTRTVVSDDPAADISRISLADVALVDQPVPLSESPSGKPGEVKIVVDRPGSFSLQTTSPTPQSLVVAESHHDGWHATLDGQIVPVLRADGDFLGVSIPAGGHEIHLEFRPNSLVLGRLMTAFGLGLIGVIVFWPVWLRRRS